MEKQIQAIDFSMTTAFIYNMKTRQAAGDGRSHKKGNFKLAMLEYHKVTEVCDLQKR